MKAFAFSASLVLILMALLICAYAQESIGQEIGRDDEIVRYETEVNQKPSDAEAHEKLGKAYAENGMLDKAIDEFEKAMRIRYNEGYEKGGEDAIRRKAFKVYGGYVILSIAVGLFIAAVVVSILSWSEMADILKSMRKNARIRTFTRNVPARLTPELRSRAVEIAHSKEKLCDVIDRESDPSLKEAASSILPRLDDLTRQASLLLELQQNLSDCIKDMDPAKLEMAQRNCEEKLRKETDQEAKRALEYQLNQMKNKRTNYTKAEAKIRTCDAVLSGIAARIDATALDLMSLPPVLLKRQEFFERVSVELDEEISLTRNAAETVMDESP